MDGGEADRVRIREVKVLSENWNPLRRYDLDYRRQDGTVQSLRREVYVQRHGAAVLATDPRRGTVLLIRQFRIPAFVNGDPDMLVETVAGVVEEGEDPALTVAREAEQETGYRLHEVRHVMTLYMSPGASSEKLHLFLARYDQADRPAKGGGVRAEGEEIEVLETPIEQAWRMVQSGEIQDAKTVLLLQHARLAGAGM
jgi:nudix-type nucleoside diphosphatase (YffH/AdpP family)